jgi:hypothetical protein
MSTDRDTTRIVRSWLEEGATALPDRVLDAVLDQVPATSQRRAWWPARRFGAMNNFAKLAVAAAAVVVVAIVGFNLLPRSGGVGGTGPTPTSNPTETSMPTPTPSSAPTASPGFIEGPLPAGTYTVAPFALAEPLGVCFVPPQTGCVDSVNDDAIRFTFTVPDGWAGAPGDSIWLTNGGNASPGGAGLIFARGAWLLTDPCQNGKNPDIKVGPTVANFVDALAKHPLLDTTTPVDVTLAGYSGKYLDLLVPADISQCDVYRPWEPGLYSQGPGHRWHLWVLDVAGIRVVVQSMDYAGTSAQRRTELQAIVDSIQIQS